MRDRDGPFNNEATLRCIVCESEFTTPSNEEGAIAFDGVREHGKNNHTDERWNYEIIDRQ